MNSQTIDHLYLWSGLLLYLKHGQHNNDWHSHYAASLLICPDDPFLLETRGTSQSCQVALLPPATENRIEVSGRLLAVMIDPDSVSYTPLSKLPDGPVWLLPSLDEHPRVRRCVERMFTGEMDEDEARLAVEDLISRLAGEAPVPQKRDLDHRLTRVLDRIREALPDEVPAEKLAEEAGLSKSRLLHLFKEQLGLPMSHYLLWRRLYESVRLWDEGMSMTEAAHAAGFYDQSHYTRTMRRMLDVTPSEISRNPNLRIHHAWRFEEEPSSRQL